MKKMEIKIGKHTTMQLVERVLKEKKKLEDKGYTVILDKNYTVLDIDEKNHVFLMYNQRVRHKVIVGITPNNTLYEKSVGKFCYSIKEALKG